MKNTPTKTKAVCVKVPVEYIHTFEVYSETNSFSEFVREAIRNELKRRFNADLKIPTIRKGVRYDLYSSDSKERAAAVSALKEAAKEARERKKFYREKQLLVVNALLLFLEALPPEIRENALTLDFRKTLLQERKRKKLTAFDLLSLYQSKVSNLPKKGINGRAVEISSSLNPYGVEIGKCLGTEIDGNQTVVQYSPGEDDEKIADFIQKQTALLKAI